MADCEQYREKIIEMIKEVENERFLKAIYISVRDYLIEEKKPA